VYKLYAIMDQTKLSGSQATFECADFLSSLLPDLDDEIASAEGFPRVVPEPAEASSARGQEKPAGETSGGATAG